MAGRTDGLIKTFRFAVATAPYRFVKFGASDTEATPAVAATDAIIGATIELPVDAGQRGDVALTGIADVTFGGPVGRGDPVTSDAQGRAIVAAPGAGTRVRIAGFAMASGVLGDIAPVHLQPGFMTGV